jgi:phosphate-selective porin OprO/OprP
MRPTSRIVLIALAALCWTIPPRLAGQPVSAAASGAEAGGPDAKSQRRFVVDREGLLLATPDRSTSMRVHGYLQGDGRLFVTNLADESHQAFLFRRIRPLVEGKVAGRFAYRFMPDFGQNMEVIQ